MIRMFGISTAQENTVLAKGLRDFIPEELKCHLNDIPNPPFSEKA
jgi:hypothetical protein